MADSRNQTDQTTVQRLPTADDYPTTDGHAVRVLDKALVGGAASASRATATNFRRRFTKRPV
jgi:hypothetical protein